MTLSPSIQKKTSIYSRWIHRVAYGLFIVLWLFELLNWIKVLNFNVEYTWLGRIVSTSVVFGVILVLEAIYKRQMKQPLHGYIIFAGVALILVDFIGDVFHLYGYWTWYDQVAHFLGGPFLVGSFYLFFQQLKQALNWNQPQIMTYLYAFETSATFALLYEVEEYLEDYFFASHRLGDGSDTANDLMLNIIGGLCTIAIISGYRYWKKRKQIA